MNLNIDFPQVKYIHEELFGFTDFLGKCIYYVQIFLLLRRLMEKCIFLCRCIFSIFLSKVASIGGAAGLFLGASVLSFCEIVYFATLRLLWFSVDEKRKQRKMKRLLHAK